MVASPFSLCCRDRVRVRVRNLSGLLIHRHSLSVRSTNGMQINFLCAPFLVPKDLLDNAHRHVIVIPCASYPIVRLRKRRKRVTLLTRQRREICDSTLQRVEKILSAMKQSRQAIR